LQRVLEMIPPAGRVLDLGCGHGRIASLLAAERPNCHYLGLDFSPDFVRLAEENAPNLGDFSARFAVADLVQPEWSQSLAGRQFDVILALALLHHIPSYQVRLDLLARARDLLAPNGRVIVSTWQFTANARMRRKIVSWDLVNVDPADLEPGDHLLDWKRGGGGYRYCHLMDDVELARLAAGAGLELVETFRADGKEGNLSLFGVLERPAL
jgi:SAM-dependent methyltransferase